MSLPLKAAKPSLDAAAAFAGGTDPFAGDDDEATTIFTPEHSDTRINHGPRRPSHIDIEDDTDPEDDPENEDDRFDDDASIEADDDQAAVLRPQRLRFSSFDTHAFSLGPAASPAQAKRALEAHLAETERRLEETGRLGTQLVHQRQDVLEQLKRVEGLDQDDEITPQLRTKLNDIEKEFNDVVKDTSRAFLPRQRIASNESATATATATATAANGSGPALMPDSRGRRSLSPSKFEILAAGSPTKLSVPNRRLRNQPSNRVKDIEFAADISTSLLQQVRNLQTLLSEREVELRDAQASQAKLEGESESLLQRLRTNDENETRFREENWNLETRVFELEARVKEGNERSEKLTQTLAIVQSEKNTIQRELDEVKVQHSKVVDDYATSVKSHDIELGTAKRSIATAEAERTAMQRKMDDLTRQNAELARAITATRGRALERDHDVAYSETEFETATDNATPEHSPPPSPVKNTPRHSMLESETLKSSLLHAQRTIQSQRTLLHREKTEKLEMRRMLQDLRDELEKARGESNSSITTRRARKTDSREFKKPPTRLLGNHRSSREEIYVDENEWVDNDEDIEGPSPHNRRLFGTPSPNPTPKSRYIATSIETDENTETSDAFETANEQATATETDDFQTGVEDMSEDSGAATETESPARGAAQRQISRRSVSRTARESFHSTASTSADEDEEDPDKTLRTPSLQVSRMRMQRAASRGLMGSRSRTVSEEPNFMSSPASYVTNSSTAGTPQNRGGVSMSLFAELQDFGSDNDSSFMDTPSRTVDGSNTPTSVFRGTSVPFEPVKSTRSLLIPQSMRRQMVDSGVNTDGSEYTVREDGLSEEEDVVLFSVGTVQEVVDESPVPVASPIVPTLSVSTIKMQLHQKPAAQLKSALPVLATTASVFGVQESAPVSVGKPKKTVPILGLSSSITHEEHSPVSIPKTESPILGLSLITLEDHSPVRMSQSKVPSLVFSFMTAMEDVPTCTPKAQPKSLPLEISAALAHNIEPTSVAPVALPALSVSCLEARADSPISLPKKALPSFAFSFAGSTFEKPTPVSKPSIAPLSLSHVDNKHSEPVVVPTPQPRSLSRSSVAVTEEEPMYVVSAVSPVFGLSGHSIADQHPVQAARAKPRSIPPSLAMSSMTVLDREPATSTRNVSATLSLSSVEANADEPVATKAPEGPVFGFAGFTSHASEPASTTRPPVEAPRLSFTPAADIALSPKRIRAPVPRALALSSHHEASVSPMVSDNQSTLSLGKSQLAAVPLEPVAVPAGPYSPLGFSAVDLQDIFPAPPTEAAGLSQPDLTLSKVTMEPVQPKRQNASSVALPVFSLPKTAVDFSPRPAVKTRQPTTLSRSLAHVDGVSPRSGSFDPAPLSMSGFTAVDMNPQPLSPKRDGFIIPHGVENPFAGKTSDDGQRFASLFSRPRDVGDKELVIAEDDTRQSLEDTHEPDMPQFRRPLKEVAGNTVRSSAVITPRSKPVMMDSSAQTTVTSDIIDDWMNSQHQTQRHISYGSAVDEIESIASTTNTRFVRGSVATSASQVPEDARRTRERQLHHSLTNSIPSHHTRPPSTTTNATSQVRPRTPAGAGYATSRERDIGRNILRQHLETPSKHTLGSRQSSVSSLRSEADHQQYEMARDLLGISAEHSRQADPRMMMAVTEVMIGEFVWKYTRRAGRNGDTQGTRRRRYFWIHPYMRMLFWCDENPMLSRRSEVVCKGSRIEAVRVATDDNPMPPGLHRKSMILMTPDGTIKFTCQTGQRHEMWFNALSYLLHRGGVSGTYEPNEMAGNIAKADLAEFNPAWRVGPSEEEHVAAYSSDPATARIASRNPHGLLPLPPSEGGLPTLVPAASASSAAAAASRTLSKKRSLQALGGRIGGVFTGTLSSLRSRASAGNMHSAAANSTAASVYRKKSFMSAAASASEAHDSAEDLRLVIEQQDRESDRLENVRACCDGKHDVGTLSHGRRHGLSHTHSHHHLTIGRSGARSTTPTPDASMGVAMGTVRSRV
ncbi:Anucleate primary sterigmata protein A [Ceratocystis lukuohia]|uniref:Anucleate primary sterigmata protein A n=1 Tax=Ceratocystis lukuohia TaxID=2019550 RepID=A0ABR4MIM8_9PEZI